MRLGTVPQSHVRNEKDRPSVPPLAEDAFDKTVILIVPDEQWARWAEENGYQWQMSGSGTPAADR